MLVPFINDEEGPANADDVAKNLIVGDGTIELNSEAEGMTIDINELIPNEELYAKENVDDSDIEEDYNY